MKQALVLSLLILGAPGCGGDPDTTGDTAGDAQAGSTTASDPTSSDPGTTDPTSTDPGATDPGDTDPSDSDATETSGEGPASPGCGRAALHPAGGVQVMIDAGPEGGGERGFWLSMPASYDPSRPHRLVVGYAGTNWVGQQIQPYLDLEQGARADEIFVYPDPLWRDFDGWGELGGWLLGPYAAPADGEQDLVFTGAVLDHMADNYCIDTTRVFATGHSWGGDMAQVVACFLGDRFRASVPIAANRPYWFESADDQFIDCPGTTAVWTLFGIADDHFSGQDYPGQFGDECRDFWLAARGCTGVDAAADLGIGAVGECLAFDGCSSPVRDCRYGPEAGHQRPDYSPSLTMNFFRSF